MPKTTKKPASRIRRIIKTQRDIDRIRPPASGHVDHRTIEKNLFLRISHRGTPSWLLMFRVAGIQERFIIGRADTLPFPKACEEAERFRLVAQSGQSPKERFELERNSGEVVTVSDLCEKFDTEYLSTLAHQKTPRGRLERWIKKHLGARRLDQITRQHFVVLEKKVKAGGARFEHTKIMKLAYQIWQFGMNENIVDANPVPYRKTIRRQRKRFLTGREIPKLWLDADSTSEDRHCPFIPSHVIAWKLIVITGQRISTVVNAEVGHFDLDAGIWTIPARLMKTEDNEIGQPHTVHLSPLAIRLVKQAIETKKPDQPYLFTGIRKRNQAVSQSWFTTKHTNWVKSMGFPPAVIHDYRRSFATLGSESGLDIDPVVIEKILAHELPAVMATYNRSELLKQRREALTSFSGWIEDITAGDNVLPFRGAKNERG